MMLGRQTIGLKSPVYIAATGTAVGPKEGKGPLGRVFDQVYEDSALGLKSWERAESVMQKDALAFALNKAGLAAPELRFLLAGDLLNQCIGSTFGLREAAVPFLGLYGACSTMAEGLALGAMLVDGDYAEHLGVVTSSHFCASERQFRLPLEYGGQRAPTAQWTVTGAGAAILSGQGGGPFIQSVTIGKIIDMGVRDVSNMGAAMAPADGILGPYQ